MFVVFVSWLVEHTILSFPLIFFSFVFCLYFIFVKNSLFGSAISFKSFIISNVASFEKLAVSFQHNI